MKDKARGFYEKSLELDSGNADTLSGRGKRKDLFPSMAIQRIDTIAPQIKAVRIPNAGHDLSVVQSDMMNEIILDFLNSF